MESFFVRFDNECKITQIKLLQPERIQEDLIDMDLYSRQIATYDMKTMHKLIKMNILIIGLKGVGVETAKNVILAGPKCVYLHDNGVCETRDLNTNFFLTEQNCNEKMTRADACVSKLSELNHPRVEVQVQRNEIDENFLVQNDISVVVLTEQRPKGKLLELNEMCRKLDVSLIFGFVNGFSASIFADHGEDFTVWDSTGLNEQEFQIQTIEKSLDKGNGIVYTEKPHRYNSGDIVKFTEVEGAIELNDREFSVRTDYEKPYSFEIDAKFSDYTDRGICVKQKQPVKMKFRTLSDSMINPIAEGDRRFINPNQSFFGRSAQIHFAQLAIWEFYETHNHLPEYKNHQHADECIKTSKLFLEKHKEIVQNMKMKENDLKKRKRIRPICKRIDEYVVRHVVLYSRNELVGLTSAVGGIVAQEVIKKTGKYTPLRQWVHFDVLSLLKEQALPSDILHPASRVFEETNKSKNFAESHPGALGGHRDSLKDGFELRYSDQIFLLGENFQTKLENLRVFIVGAGALGCEYLKCFALMGVGCGPKGSLTITDMDSITVSNLNRQFLFRPKDVKKSKSKCAVEAIAQMNPQTAGNSHELKDDENKSTTRKYSFNDIEVSPATENVFDFNFWESLDVVVTAVDNKQARRYIDSKCLLHRLPLLESGTLGVTGQTYVFIPHLTNSYVDTDIGGDDEENIIPVCTLKYFPYQIEHCIEWAREQFENVFVNEPKIIGSFLNDRIKFLDALRLEKSSVTKQKTILTVKSWILKLSSFVRSGVNVFIGMSLQIFEKEFQNDILDLIESFPKDFSYGNPPVPYWGGRRRFPTPQTFDLNNKTHLNFVVAASNIFVSIFSSSEQISEDDIRRFLENYEPAPYNPSRSLTVLEEPDNVKEVEGAIESKIDLERDFLELKEIEISTSLESIDIKSTEFEKDDDSNHHIDFITAFSNLRASNYSIRQATRHSCKLIAGKIMPAVATSTAVVCGFNAIELMKLVIGNEKLSMEDFRSTQVMLGCPPFVDMLQPLPPDLVTTVEEDPIFLDKVCAVPEGFSTWDSLRLFGNFTVASFKEELSSQHFGVSVITLRKHGHDVQRSIDISDENKNLRELYCETYECSLNEFDPIFLGGIFTTAKGDYARIPRICCFPSKK